MKFIKSIIFMTVLMLTVAERGECLLSSDLCIKQKIECNLTVSNKTICHESVCDKRRSFKCGLVHCSTSKEACKYHESLNFFLTQFSRELGRVLANSLIKQIKEFKAHIPYCPKLSIAELKVENVCNKAKSCFLIDRLMLIFFQSFMIKQRSRWDQCQCPKEFGLECGQTYCVKDLNSCQIIRQSERLDASSKLITNNCHI